MAFRQVIEYGDLMAGIEQILDTDGTDITSPPVTKLMAAA
jgi:hypothetical protein